MFYYEDIDVSAVESPDEIQLIMEEMVKQDETGLFFLAHPDDIIEHIKQSIPTAISNIQVYNPNYLALVYLTKEQNAEQAISATTVGNKVIAIRLFEVTFTADHGLIVDAALKKRLEESVKTEDITLKALKMESVVEKLRLQFNDFNLFSSEVVPNKNPQGNSYTP